MNVRRSCVFPAGRHTGQFAKSLRRLLPEHYFQWNEHVNEYWYGNPFLSFSRWGCRDGVEPSGMDVLSMRIDQKVIKQFNDKTVDSHSYSRLFFVRLLSLVLIQVSSGAISARKGCYYARVSERHVSHVRLLLCARLVRPHLLCLLCHYLRHDHVLYDR